MRQSVGSGVGETAPSFRLPDLDGRIVELSDFRGRDTLLLFWNPSCGFCSQMLPDLRDWESNRPREAPELVLVSTGSAEVNKSLGVQSTIVLDQGFSTGSAFGASGTPSAVMIDAEGKITSQVGVGAPAVLALARLGRLAAPVH